MCMYQINKKKLDLVVEIDPAVPKQVFQDKNKFERVIYRLVSNAVKHTQKGYIKVTIKMEVSDFGEPAIQQPIMSDLNSMYSEI